MIRTLGIFLIFAICAPVAHARRHGPKVSCEPATANPLSDENLETIHTLLDGFSKCTETDPHRRVFCDLSSFASILLNDQKNAPLIRDLGADCGAFLKKLYKSGDTLWTKTLSDASSPATVTSFHHWTNSDALLGEVQQAIPDLPRVIFEYLHGEPVLSNYSFKMDGRVFYVASSPSSSSAFGKARIDVTLRPQARQIEPSQIDLTAAVTELSDRFPGFSRACAPVPPGNSNAVMVGTTTNPSIYLMLEDSGIDLVNYCENLYCRANHDDWFQLVSSRNVESVKVPAAQ